MPEIGSPWKLTSIKFREGELFIPCLRSPELLRFGLSGCRQLSVPKICCREEYNPHENKHVGWNVYPILQDQIKLA